MKPYLSFISLYSSFLYKMYIFSSFFLSFFTSFVHFFLFRRNRIKSPISRIPKSWTRLSKFFKMSTLVKNLSFSKLRLRRSLVTQNLFLNCQPSDFCSLFKIWHVMTYTRLNPIPKGTSLIDDGFACRAWVFLGPILPTSNSSKFSVFGT